MRCPMLLLMTLRIVNPAHINHTDRAKRRVGRQSSSIPRVFLRYTQLDTMALIHQACATIVLVVLTIALDSAGMAGLIEWAKAHFGKSGRGNHPSPPRPNSPQ